MHARFYFHIFSYSLLRKLLNNVEYIIYNMNFLSKFHLLNSSYIPLMEQIGGFENLFHFNNFISKSITSCNLNIIGLKIVLRVHNLNVLFYKEKNSWRGNFLLIYEGFREILRNFKAIDLYSIRCFLTNSFSSGHMQELKYQKKSNILRIFFKFHERKIYFCHYKIKIKSTKHLISALTL